MPRTPIQKARATAWKWYSIYMRTLRAIEEMGDAKYARCVTCGAVKPFAKVDAAHFIPGRSDAVLFVEDNTHCSCVPCNRFKQGQWVPYFDFMVERYGTERVAQLMRLYYVKTKYTEAELRDIATEYRLKYKSLLKENGKYKELKDGKAI